MQVLYAVMCNPNFMLTIITRILKDFISQCSFTYLSSLMLRECVMCHSHSVSHINYLESDTFSAPTHSLVSTAYEVIWGYLNFETKVRSNRKDSNNCAKTTIYLFSWYYQAQDVMFEQRWRTILPPTVSYLDTCVLPKKPSSCPMVRILLEASVFPYVSEINS